MQCPLCYDDSIDLYLGIKERKYLICKRCDLVFVPEKNLLSPEEEKRRYDLHENDIGDSNYQEFLSQLLNPMLEVLNPPALGLDYGCGPGPALANMFEKQGYSMKIYDPFYANDPGVLDKKYDFITCTEVVEHFHEPGKEFSQIINLLKPKGFLGIMTDLRVARKDFKNWHYRRDPTHVCFYSDKTFDWISQEWGLKREKISSRVNIFEK